jgi:hypothetical protein
MWGRRKHKMKVHTFDNKIIWMEINFKYFNYVVLDIGTLMFEMIIEIYVYYVSSNLKWISWSYDWYSLFNI